MVRRIAFIAWDGPYVTYLEGLFVPIFAELVKRFNYEFHILHFSWGMPSTRREAIKYLCSKQGISYHHYEVKTGPIAALGKYFALRSGAEFIRRFVTVHNIDLLIPRSTMPARMVLTAFRSGTIPKIVFDADGLPIEERLDFAGLKRGSFKYNRLKAIENGILRSANAILTRSAVASRYLADSHKVPLSKFTVVSNGRDPNVYLPNLTARKLARRKLNVPDDALVMVYCGSVGPQYGFNQMVATHVHLNKRLRSYLLLLVNNTMFELPCGDEEMKSRVIVRSASVDEVPFFLSAADVGLAIRKDSFSMRGVAPIKIAEYLLTGLPIVASAGVGDAMERFASTCFAYLLSDYTDIDYVALVDWILSVYSDPLRKEMAREYAVNNFSIERSADSYEEAIKSVL